MQELLTERDVLTALGGATAVARYVGLGRTTVSAWQVEGPCQGIPHRYHHQLVQLASYLRVEGINHEMLTALRDARERSFRAKKRSGGNDAAIEGRAA